MKELSLLPTRLVSPWRIGTLPWALRLHKKRAPRSVATDLKLNRNKEISDLARLAPIWVDDVSTAATAVDEAASGGA